MLRVNNEIDKTNIEFVEIGEQEMETSNDFTSILMNDFDLYRNQNEFADTLYYLAKKVLILGAGSTGSHIALSLARLGVGEFLLIDGDIIKPHNCISSAYNIREVYDKYYIENSFRASIGEYNRSHRGNFFKTIPYKVSILSEMIRNQTGVVSNVKTIAQYVKPLTIQHFDLHSIERFREGLMVQNALDGEEFREYWRPTVDEINKTMLDYFNTSLKFNKFMRLALPTDLFKSYISVNHITAFPMLIFDMSITEVEEEMEGTDNVTFEQKQIFGYSNFFSEINGSIDTIILCTDNFLARLSTLQIARLKYKTMEKRVIPVIDTRVGNTIEGEIVVFNLNDTDQFKKWLGGILNLSRNTVDDVYSFSDEILKIRGEDIIFLETTDDVCGDTMSIISALQITSLTVSLFAQIYKNTEIPKLDRVDMYHRFKLGSNGNEYSRYYMTAKDII